MGDDIMPPVLTADKKQQLFSCRDGSGTTQASIKPSAACSFVLGADHTAWIRTGMAAIAAGAVSCLQMRYTALTRATTASWLLGCCRRKRSTTIKRCPGVMAEA